MYIRRSWAAFIESCQVHGKVLLSKKWKQSEINFFFSDSHLDELSVSSRTRRELLNSRFFRTLLRRLLDYFAEALLRATIENIVETLPVSVSVTREIHCHGIQGFKFWCRGIVSIRKSEFSARMFPFFRIGDNLIIKPRDSRAALRNTSTSTVDFTRESAVARVC